MHTPNTTRNIWKNLRTNTRKQRLLLPHIPSPLVTAILQHTAIHSATCLNALQHAATHCNALHRTATRCNTLQRAATHCNTLLRTAKQAYCDRYQIHRYHRTRSHTHARAHTQSPIQAKIRAFNKTHKTIIIRTKHILICVSACTHTHMNTYIYIHIYMCVHVCVWACAYAYEYMWYRWI